MPGEKQNSWQEKLSALETVPSGILFEKDRQWNKLEVRLSRPRKKRFFLAAALLLLVASAYLLYPSSKKIPAVTTSTRTINVVVPPVVLHHNQVAKPVKKDIASRVIFREPTSPLKTETKASPEPMSVPDTLQQAAVVAVQNKDSLSVARPVVATSKRRFPIAHINELHTTAGPSPAQPEPNERNAMAVQTRRYATQTSINPEERELTPRRNKAFFSLIKSSQ